MLTGTVTADLQPVLLLPISGQIWPAHLDTGFNGDLELPEQLRTVFNPPYLGRSLSELAGGQTVLENLYEIEFTFDGQTMPAETTFVNSDNILIGTRLMREFRLVVDFPKRSVELQRVI